MLFLAKAWIKISICSGSVTDITGSGVGILFIDLRVACATTFCISSQMVD